MQIYILKVLIKKSNVHKYKLSLVLLHDWKNCFTFVKSMKKGTKVPFLPNDANL